MDSPLFERLQDFAADLRPGKGALCVLLVVTDHARKLGLPLDASDLLTEGKGQVKGLGKAAVQKILARHGITKVLAREGGRTSRNSAENMRRYVAFLNSQHSAGWADLEAVEKFWIAKVREFLAGKPFRLSLDSNRSLRAVVTDLLRQAFKRQESALGRTDAGALLQHLVGAKLACAMHPEPVEHNSFSTADAPTSRRGDFEVGDTVIHVTTSPGEAVIERCKQDLAHGLHPILITLLDRVPVAAGLARNIGIEDRFDILDVEQFLVLNLYEWRRFQTANRRATLEDIISRYNAIVDQVETDPGLKIAFR